MDERAWYYIYVAAGYSMGLVDGRSEAEFRPQEDVTVAEAVKLASVLRRKYLGGDDFRPSEPWYQVYIDFALDCGMLSSAPADPNAPVSRLEFAKIVAAAMPETEYAAINRVEDGAIPGVEGDGAEAVYLLYRAGVLTGGEGAEFRPQDTLRRAEAAAALVRAAQPAYRERFTLTVYTGTVEVDAQALADEVFALTNEFRAESGLAPLERDAALEEAAALRARELAQSFSHTRPGGGSFASALDECGAEYMSAGENIASGYVTAADAFEGWTESPGHAANIAGDYARLAVACHVSEAGVAYWVQLFAR